LARVADRELEFASERRLIRADPPVRSVAGPRVRGCAWAPDHGFRGHCRRPCSDRVRPGSVAVAQISQRRGPICRCCGQVGHGRRPLRGVSREDERDRRCTALRAAPTETGPSAREGAASQSRTEATRASSRVARCRRGCRAALASGRPASFSEYQEWSNYEGDIAVGGPVRRGRDIFPECPYAATSAGRDSPS
jgi:hypothetical protein